MYSETTPAGTAVRQTYNVLMKPNRVGPNMDMDRRRIVQIQAVSCQQALHMAFRMYRPEWRAIEATLEAYA